MNTLPRLKSLVLCSALAIASTVTFAVCAGSEEHVETELIYFLPDCNEPGQRSTWCPGLEKIKFREQQKRIIDMLFAPLNSDKADIFLATYSYNNFNLSDFLCEQTRNNSNVTIIADFSYAGHAALNVLAEKCEGPKVKILYLAKKDLEQELPIHHNKLLMIKSENSDNVNIIFGTANATLSSFGMHFELWNSAVTHRESNFARQHDCFKQALISAAEEEAGPLQEDGAKIFNIKLSSCRNFFNIAGFEEALEKEGIAPLFIPADSQIAEEALKDAVNNAPAGSEIVGAAHLLTSSSVIRALMRASARGVKVRIVTDDDTLSGHVDSYETAKTYRKNLKNSGIEFKFIETNHTIPQLMHMKFLLIDRKLLITGSGQFSHAALHQNYENFYFSNNKALIKQYQNLFDKLWDLGFSDPGHKSGIMSRISRMFASYVTYVRRLFGLDS